MVGNLGNPGMSLYAKRIAPENGKIGDVREREAVGVCRLVTVG